MQTLVFILLITQLLHNTIAVSLPQNGIGGIPGYDLVFQTVDYMPICGNLASLTSGASGTHCALALSIYNSTSDVTALYDITGVKFSKIGGKVPTGCMCFTLSSIQGDKRDICLHLDENGNWAWTSWAFMYVFSSFGISIKNQSLPQCKDVDIASISSSAYAAISNSF